MTSHLHRLRHQAHKTYDALGLSEHAMRRRTIAKFAQKFGLIYFRTIDTSSPHFSLVRGVTNSIGQKDSNMCIGVHDGYDMVFIEREATLQSVDQPPVRHRWHIMEFDLHSHDTLPFLFIGTKQQSKAFYSKLFTMHRDVRYVGADFLQSHGHFLPHYSVVASPAAHLYVTGVLTEEITGAMAKYQYPFAIEIRDDSLFVITEVGSATTIQPLTRMLHYGIWLARHLDSRQL